MDILEPLSKQNWWQIALTLAARFLLPFLLGGFTFHFGLGQRQVILTLRADIARLEKQLETVDGKVTKLAGIVPLPDEHESQPKNIRN